MGQSLECFWLFAVWAVVLAMGICTESQPNPQVTTRSHLVSRHLAPHHLVPHHLVPCCLDPTPRTLLPLLAWRQAQGRVTMWRYVGSTCQLGGGATSCGQRVLQLETEETVSCPHWALLVEPLETHLLKGPRGNRWAHPGTVKPTLVLLLLGSGSEGSDEALAVIFTSGVGN